jgi:hypothetical protein
MRREKPERNPASTYQPNSHENLGTRKYKIGIEAFQQCPAAWAAHEFLWTGDFDFQVEPSPTYTAFVSCSNRDEDRDIVDFIKSRIRLWGFNTITVGQEVEASRGLAQTIRDQATKADCLIAIATPRILDAITNAWETLPWAHGETGITYAKEKPILILRDRSVRLGGLIGQIPWQSDYDANNRKELSVKLDFMMPSFRAWIATKKSSEFLNTLLKLGVAAFGLAIAYEVGRESRRA